MIAIREPREGDVPALLELMNCPGVRYGTARMPFTTEGWVRTRVPTTNPNVTSVVALVDDTARGSASFLRGSDRSAHSAQMGFSVHDRFTRRGLGRAMMTALIEVADRWLGLRRLHLTVSVDNAAAIGLYHSAGFEIEGRLRGDILRDGMLVDSYAMARVRDAAPFFVGPVDDGPVSEGSRNDAAA
ncbi:MAG: GNAT family N-acetyltransferase [Pseudomonadota bacterium]